MDRNGMAVVARLRGVTKTLGGRPVLNAISLEVRAGEVTALLGPNGAGKTTTVGVLTGRFAPDAGEAELFGLDPGRPAARARIGVVLQSAGLPDVLTVRELVSLHSGYYRRPREIHETMALAGLEGLEKRRAGALSGGQLRRLHYALAICGQPDLLVLDEPTTGLDHEARRRLWSSVRAEADAGTAVLLTTHYLEEADALADRIIVIDDGRIVADATPSGIKADVAGSTIRCRTMLPDPALAALPGVRSVRRSGGAATLLVADGAVAARALLGADPSVSDLTISAASLEDALGDLSATIRKAA
ncbi:ABC transporter ATP-binding protein [Allosphingosinicella deserti]|uniref:Multidrug ABC transporter ATP-binding protein n=1 Tax=Allosphingosinicella deserti TaxID=2116704 RepID=A0A2P7QIZ4_9SPHN|nr:ABC transporter ATP-binding protein [Sphingomonas deserti]PSJ37932.1 multidrug ABC transporter ATP-binding protein [Sphingomonas deserti]